MCGFVMKFKLQIFTEDNIEGNYLGRRYRFAVIDSDKAKGYPSNFICMLPSQISVDQKKNSVFSKLFGEKCEEQAKTLLIHALASENNPEVKTEIERRLKLLDPKTINQIKCSSCGKLFQPKRIRKFKRNYCQDCMNKSYGNRG
jgi:formylmethanofuran dehydrogenase subunit E